MSLSHVTHIKIQWIYLLSDFAVLVLSLSYIPLNRMVYSILTVLLSGQIIGFVQTAGTHPVENMELDRFHTVLPVSNVPTREQ